MCGCCSRAVTRISSRNRSAPTAAASSSTQHLDRDAAVVPEVAREVHGRHAPARELTLDRVTTGERRRESVGDGIGGVPNAPSASAAGRSRKAWSRAVVRGEERCDLAPQIGVAAARIRDEGVAPCRLAGERRLEDGVHGAPPFGRHRRRCAARRAARSAGVVMRSSSRRSHIRAMAHSRPTVAGETPSAAAASGMLSPAK